MNTLIQIALPWPPSTNTYWRHPSRGPLAGRHLISEQGRAYRAAVIGIAPRLQLAGRLAVHITVTPPDRRRRDIDNLLKGLLDSLTHAGVWLDDEQIDDLRITRTQAGRAGQVIVCVTTAGGEHGQ